MDRSMNIEERPVDQVLEDPRNPREISVEAFARLKGIVQEFGLVSPLVVDESGVLIGGHQRLAVCRELEMQSVPVVVVAGLAEPQRRALMVALNNEEAQGTWNEDKLAKILSEAMEDDSLGSAGFDEAFAAGLVGSKRGRSKGLAVKPTPAYTWVLMAFETPKYGKVSIPISKLAECAAFVEICMSDDQPPAKEPP
jgi:hypothetical protein